MVVEDLEVFLSDKVKRESLSVVLLDCNVGQEDLFISEKEKKERLSVVLDEVTSLIRERKPLYDRWSQNKGEKQRVLSVPKKQLKEFLSSYVLGLIKQAVPHKRCHGGEIGWSVKRSLETHLPCKCAISFDLESAFLNLRENLVYEFFYSLLNASLSSSERSNISRFLSLLCTVDYKGERGLPQGSPCSMALFNRALYNLDELLENGARSRGFKYSRWIDDMTISSSSGEKIERFLGAVELTNNRLPVSKEKLFFQDGERIYLLGHKVGRQVVKNSKQEKLENKSSPLNFDEIFSSKRKCYESWN